jgi:hypothetical protein
VASGRLVSCVGIGISLEQLGHHAHLIAIGFTGRVQERTSLTIGGIDIGAVLEQAVNNLHIFCLYDCCAVMSTVFQQKVDNLQGGLLTGQNKKCPYTARFLNVHVWLLEQPRQQLHVVKLNGETHGCVEIERGVRIIIDICSRLKQSLGSRKISQEMGLELLPCGIISAPRLARAGVSTECQLYVKKEIFNDNEDHTTTIVMS